MKTRKGYKVYPLTAAQKLHFYCLKYCPKKQVLNIGSSLTIESDLDWDVLRECIKEAIARCDSCASGLPGTGMGICTSMW